MKKVKQLTSGWVAYAVLAEKPDEMQFLGQPTGRALVYASKEQAANLGYGTWFSRHDDAAHREQVIAALIETGQWDESHDWVLYVEEAGLVANPGGAMRVVSVQERAMPGRDMETGEHLMGLVVQLDDGTYRTLLFSPTVGSAIFDALE